MQIIKNEGEYALNNETSASETIHLQGCFVLQFKNQEIHRFSNLLYRKVVITVHKGKVSHTKAVRLASISHTFKCCHMRQRKIPPDDKLY